MFNIDREHPEYSARKAMWKRYRDLYVGGEQMRAAAAEYLIQRNKEPLSVYAERLSHVYYENFIGSIIDWYAATMFRREPYVHIEGPETAGRRYFASFMDDCDMQGTSFTDFFRSTFVTALVCGTSYVLIDFPALRVAAGKPRGGRGTRGLESLPGGIPARGTHQLEHGRAGQPGMGCASNHEVPPANHRGYHHHRRDPLELLRQGAVPGLPPGGADGRAG